MKKEEIQHHLAEAQKHLAIIETNTKDITLQAILKAARMDIISAKLAIELK